MLRECPPQPTTSCITPLDPDTAEGTQRSPGNGEDRGDGKGRETEREREGETERERERPRGRERETERERERDGERERDREGETERERERQRGRERVVCHDRLLLTNIHHLMQPVHDYGQNEVTNSETANHSSPSQYGMFIYIYIRLK